MLQLWILFLLLLGIRSIERQLQLFERFKITFTANGKHQMEEDNYEKNPIQNPSYFLTDEPQRHKTSNIREL